MNPGTTRGRRILLLAPAGPNTRAMEEVLSQEGIAVSVAHDVFSAVARSSSVTLDGAVLSLTALDERDLEVFRFLRERRPGIFLLVSFPPDRRELAVRALAAGADAYLLEPFYLGEFLELVRRGLRRLVLSEPPVPEVAPAQASRELERLAGAVAHAVNNPLQILTLLVPEGPDAPEFVQEISRIHAVADELLAYSRRTDYTPAPGCDLNRILRTVLEARYPGLTGVTCQFGDPVSIHGDEAQLRRAFDVWSVLPAVRSGRRHMKVTTSPDPETPEPALLIRFEVPELRLTRAEISAHAEPFASIFAGQVGLAGAIAHDIIRMHGGTIDLLSSAREGTVLDIRLPVRTHPQPGEGFRPAQEG